MFATLCFELLIDSHSSEKPHINDLGHTVLDSLMASILKSHTSRVPGVVHTTFGNDQRFAGEEVDICGRWDADSDSIRHCWRWVPLPYYSNGKTHSVTRRLR